ncbi:type VII secretion integral membrane protein EccD [Nocardioides psychrotolerans]|uniref:Type VII secretion integral membrane protein EccD n=1 Tax=Nocardioides psychrotolerans TaxID=1005945 RepID=A0A1I3DZ55_9ACTN|nr:EsaB/YukD family protein [Nocardioides psychrotolerans]GEP37578.1 type VII secretion integral membrane protein EccD [Nocardioides psychrotolerans]SFH92024.1 type VII secretion integral membrane protein EccD [Nocardioides psychrotolerans]
MSQTPVGTSGLVRVTVTSGARRVDLVLPGAVPVAELVPELARSVGMLDATTVYGGYHLLTSEGRRLATDSGLTLQGVEDGVTLTVTAGIDDVAPRVYDDVVEAMTDVVERDLKPWQPASGRRTALSAGALLMALGAVSLIVQEGSQLAAAAAATVALVLVAGAIVLSRVQVEAEAAVAVAWMGAGYAAVAGFMLAPEGGLADLSGTPVACAGAGAMVAGLICLVGLGDGRTLVIPPVLVGAVFLGTGFLVDSTEVDPTILLPIVMTVVVMIGSVFPWLALGVTKTTVDQLYSTADITADPDEVDAGRVGADARVAHEILIAISGTVGLLLVLIAPVAVSRGLFGTLLVVVACLIVMLRTRQYRTGSEVLVGLVSGIVGLVAVAASVLTLHEAWRPVAAVVLAASGAVLLAVTLLPSTPSVRRGRFGDVVESIALLTLLPLLVLAVGAFESVRGS